MMRTPFSVRLPAALLCCGLVALPFLSVRFAPLADLPQQVAQIRLFLEALHNPAGPYRIQWGAPNWLSYSLLGAAWALFDPRAAGRVAMLLVGCLWVGAIHLLSAKRGRPIESAVLTSALFFNHIVYWGFYNFAVGWPIFVLWFLVLGRNRTTPFSWTDGLSILAVALLLFASHALWLAAGMVWLVLSQVVFRAPLRTATLRIASLLPVMALAMHWYPKLAAAGFTSQTYWGLSPLQRLSPAWLVDAAFGGLRGPLEPLLLAFVAGWALLSVWQHRVRLLSQVDAEMVAAGIMFGTFALLLPYKHTNTIQFAERWFPIALTMLVLGLPAPAISLWLRRGGSVVLLGALCVYTATQWNWIEKRELSGLSQAIDSLPASPQVVGLDFLQTSSVLKIHRPFLQTFAYAQAVKGGSLNFSFADFASSLVVYQPPRSIPWTGGLEWLPERVTSSDLQFFSHAIVSGSPALHALAASKLMLQPLTHEGIWRLYAVTP